MSAMTQLDQTSPRQHYQSLTLSGDSNSVRWGMNLILSLSLDILAAQCCNRPARESHAGQAAEEVELNWQQWYQPSLLSC